MDMTTIDIRSHLQDALSLTQGLFFFRETGRWDREERRERGRERGGRARGGGARGGEGRGRSSRCNAHVTKLDDGGRRRGRRRLCLEVDVADSISLFVRDLDVSHGRRLQVGHARGMQWNVHIPAHRVLGGKYRPLQVALAVVSSTQNLSSPTEPTCPPQPPPTSLFQDASRHCLAQSMISSKPHLSVDCLPCRTVIPLARGAASGGKKANQT